MSTLQGQPMSETRTGTDRKASSVEVTLHAVSSQPFTNRFTYTDIIAAKFSQNTAREVDEAAVSFRSW